MLCCVLFEMLQQGFTNIESLCDEYLRCLYVIESLCDEYLRCLYGDVRTF